MKNEEIAADIQEYLDGVWDHLTLWKKKDMLEQAGFILAISAKQEEYLVEMQSKTIFPCSLKSEDLEI